MPNASASNTPTESLPLTGMRIVELANGKTDMAGRMLADLGAEVILIESPQGSPVRQQAPLYGGVSLYFATHHANKRSVVLDLHSAQGHEQFLDLLATADVLLDGTRPGELAALELSAEQLLAVKPTLTLLSLTDFGQFGPYRDYQATSVVHTAMAGVLSRSGKPGMMPLLPPGSLALESAAIQAAFAALLGYWQQLHTGAGDHLDFSIYEAIAQVLDPGLGVTGSASGGKSSLDSTPHGRPVAMPLYPIIPCKDGHVRICVLNPRQWQAMSEWLGPDHAFVDPMYSAISKRIAAAQEINALFAELFRQFDGAELAEEAQRRGVPLAVMATPVQVLQDPHFNARGTFTTLQVAPGIEGKLPSGFLEIDGVRAGIRDNAPALGQDNGQVLAGLPKRPAALDNAVTSPAKRGPLQGLRVLDLGVIVAGAEGGRMFADHGAEVIKVENYAFPDGGRQSATGDVMTPSIAQGHRNKLSFGVNLRSAIGLEIFKLLVAQSDVVLSNFKPGTLESLGLGPEVLLEVNPRIVLMDSSALGNTGPQSRTMGYGPLVRASTGLSSLWCYPDVPNSYSDGTTIYPDHIAARVAALGVLALLIRRERTGRGGQVSMAQAEIFLNSNTEHYLRESLQPGSFVPRGNESEFRAPEGVYPCAGDDEWCALSVCDEAQWQQLLAVVGRQDLLDDTGLVSMAGRIARRAEVDALVSEWTQRHTPREVTIRLQAAGVPAGFMQRLSEYRSDPHFSARHFIRTLEHRGLTTSLPTENGLVLSRTFLDPELRPAPYQAEHTREIAGRLLGYSEAQIDALIAAGDLEDVLAPAS